MSFRLVSKSLTLNFVMAVFALFIDFGSFRRALRKMVEDIPKLSAVEM